LLVVGGEAVVAAPHVWLFKVRKIGMGLRVVD
jgi:hypothetical protein